MNNIFDELDKIWLPWPEKVLLQSGEKTLSYLECKHEVETFVKQLIHWQAKSVALQADNCMQWVVVDLACQQLGIALLPLPGFFSAEQIQHSVQTCACDLLLTDNLALIEQAFGKGQNQPTRLQASSNQDSHSQLTALSCFKLDCASTAHEGSALPEQTSKITFTSGSTGAPKGVCLSRAQQWSVARAIKDVIKASQDQMSPSSIGSHLCILPLATLLENIAGLYAPMLNGSTIVLPGLSALGFSGSSSLNFSTLLQQISQTGAASFITTPEILKGLIRAIEQGWQVPKRLKFIAVGGARVAAELIQLAHCLGLPAFEGYGLSECGSVVSLNAPGCNKAGSAGKALPHVELSVQHGELIVSGNTFLGYAGQRDSWHQQDYATGDLATIDEQGFLHITGRKKNLMISSFGRNISPEWLESALCGIKQIRYAMVFGDDMPYCIAGITSLSSDSSQVAQLNQDSGMCEAIEQLNQRLPDYARIKQWFYMPVSDLHSHGLITANGRLKRAALAAHFEQQISRNNPSNKTNNRNTKMNFFDRLKQQTSKEQQYLLSAPIIARCMSGDVQRDDYIAFLKEAYHHVKHTVPLLMNVGAKLPEQKEWLREAVAEYIEEELGHQEWILNDINNCGYDKESVRASTPNFATELMVSYAYDAINRKNPLTFFGMVHVLEGTSIAMADNAAKSIGASVDLPPQAFSYLTSHGALDIAHVQFFADLMNKISDEKEQEIIINAAKAFYRLYGDIFRSLNPDHCVPLTDSL